MISPGLSGEAFTCVFQLLWQPVSPSLIFQICSRLISLHAYYSVSEPAHACVLCALRVSAHAYDQFALSPSRTTRDHLAAHPDVAGSSHISRSFV